MISSLLLYQQCPRLSAAATTLSALSGRTRRVLPTAVGMRNTPTTTAACRRRIKSTMVHSSNTTITPPPPTRRQKWLVFCQAALPMIGFGFTDQTIMIHAGNAIDCTLGVTFGLSTLTAASVGALVSNSCGVVFGNSLETFFCKAGILPKSNLSSAQRKLPVIKRISFGASVCGMILGGLLGLSNLVFIDTNRSSSLKLTHAHVHHDNDSNNMMDLQYTIQASNSQFPEQTVLTVEGPDVDGLLASMTAALATQGASICEIQAKRIVNVEDDKSDNDNTTQSNNKHRHIRDVFYVVDADTGEQFDDDDLEDLAMALLDSTRTPHAVHHVQAKITQLESRNSYLQERIKALEQHMYEKQITVLGSSGEALAAARHATRRMTRAGSHSHQ